GSRHSPGAVGRKPPQDPARVERLAHVRPAVDSDEVAGARIHRQPRLGREVAVVALDQLVHLGEAPVAGELAPSGRERSRVLVLLSERPPRLRELALVLVDGVLDRPQPPHPNRRPAERPHRGLGVGPEVPHPLPEDRKSTRLNSSHRTISYAVFCLKKKKKQKNINTPQKQ